MSDAVARASDLLKVLTRLIDILQQENKLLRQMKPSEMQALQQDKIVLVAAYESLLEQLRQDPDCLRSLDPVLREQIMQVTGAFQDTLAANARALFAVKEANERLFKAIIKAVEEQHQESNQYSAAGVIAHESGLVGRKPVSVALDQRL